MDSSGSKLNEHSSSGCAAPEAGEVVEIKLADFDLGLLLRLKGIVRDRTSEGFRVEFLADTPDERHELNLFRQRRGDVGLRESDCPRSVYIVTKS